MVWIVYFVLGFIAFSSIVSFSDKAGKSPLLALVHLLFAGLCVWSIVIVANL